ncbi:hypothetical protein MAR_001307, partial [Mya arenaria]
MTILPFGAGISVLARRTSIHLSSILRSCLVQYKIQDRSVMVVEAVRTGTRKGTKVFTRKKTYSTQKVAFHHYIKRKLA